MSYRINRRNFIKKTFLFTTAVSCFSVFDIADSFAETQFEARYYEKLSDKQVLCNLCPNECVIPNGERGICGVRENREGKLYSLVYAKPCTWHADPIEKKPFYHFLPGTLAYSIATAGCNVECKFCQNWQIAQSRPEEIRQLDMPPATIVKNAKRNQCLSIAYTYNEPVIFQEFMVDTAKIGKENGIRSVMVSNGYINKKPLKEICQNLDAIKIDLKAFREEYYNEIVDGELKPVLDTLLTLKKEGIWFEIVYLVVPTLNDSEEEIRDMCKWVVQNLGKNVPVHFSRFHPQYKLRNLPATPKKTLDMAYKIGLEEGINYVYVGNLPGHKGESTYCPSCKKTIIKRIGYTILEINISNGKCDFCGTEIAGVWE